MPTVVQFRTTSSALAKTEEGEARFALRKRVLKGAVAASNDRRLTIPCTLKDISDTGARLKVSTSVTVPDTFELIIDIDGLEADCQVIWRSNSEIGVKFIGAPRKSAARRVQVICPIVPAKAPTLRRKPILGSPQQ
jgi:hypothetical protein